MKSHELTMPCQLADLGRMHEGIGETPSPSLGRRVKLMIRRYLSPAAERRLKSRMNAWMNWYCRVTGRPERPVAKPAAGAAVHLSAGDWVRVLPRAERIRDYIESFGLPSIEKPLPEECVRIMYMLEAAEEAGAYDDIR